MKDNFLKKYPYSTLSKLVETIFLAGTPLVSLIIYYKSIADMPFYKFLLLKQDVFYQADGVSFASNTLHPFAIPSFRHPIRDVIMFPFHLLSNWVSLLQINFLAQSIFMISVIVSIGAIIRAHQSANRSYLIPFAIAFSCTGVLTWLFIPDTFLISGCLIFVSLYVTAHNESRFRIFLMGFLAGGMNIVGIVPWICAILLKKKFSLLTRLRIILGLLVCLGMWVGVGKLIFGHRTRTNTVSTLNVLKDSATSNAGIAPNIHLPLFDSVHIYLTYLTSPWISAFGNSNSQAYMNIFFILLSTSFTLFSILGLLIQTKNCYYTQRNFALSLLVFEATFLIIIFCFGNLTTSYLFSPLIAPGRILGLIFFWQTSRIRNYVAFVYLPVAMMGLVTISSNLYL